MKSFFLKSRVSSGFSLLEILFSLAVLLIVISSALLFLNGVYGLNFKLNKWVNSSQDSHYVLNDLEFKIRNMIKLIPQEDLLLVGDKKYYGIATLTSAQVPAYCKSDVNFNGLIVTSINRKRRPERLLRSFNETLSSGQSGGAAELRLTADATADSLFQASTGPKEIVLVDADRKYARRYKVRSYVMKLNTPIDPYDDIDKSPTLFNYVSILVDNAKNISGQVQALTPSVFVSHSIAFESSTNIFCADLGGQNYITRNIESGEQRNVYIPQLNQAVLEKLVYSFNATKKGQRLSQSNFLPDIFDTTISSCVNVGMLTMDFNPQNSGAKHIIRKRIFFLPNLSFNRPIVCNL